MPEITRKFGVARRGTGKPDFVVRTKPERPTIMTEPPGSPAEEPIEHTKPWRDLWFNEDPISGDSMETIEAYTVPSGWRLYMGGGFISCDGEVMQLVKLVATPGILGDFWYKLRGDLILAGHAIYVFEPGTTLTYYVFNKDTEEHFFSISLLGTLEKI